MTAFILKRPIAVFMSFLGLIILGIIVSFRLPVSLLPDIKIPEITVFIKHSDFTARELENFAVKPLRRQLMECTEIEGLKSETRNGNAVIHLRFKYGVNTDFAAIDVNEKIDRAMGWLPKGIERPKVIKASANDIPILYLSINQKDEQGKYDFLELSEFVRNVIRKRIEQLDEVALVDLTGTEKAELVIYPDINKLQTLGLNNESLGAFFKNNNIPIGSVQVRDGYLQYNVRFSSQLRSAEDLENIFLNVAGKVIQFKDIARVVVKPKQLDGLFLVNDSRGMSLAIIKKPNAKVDELKSQLNHIITQLKRDYPEMEFRIAQDQSTFLDYSIENLKSSLITGGILAFIVVLLFLSNLKLSFLVGTTMPVCLIISLLFFLVFGITVNVISLAGLILGTGLIIDNSIIVIDSITQYRERGFNVEDACVGGVREVIVPLLSSTLTTCAVFVPMVFVSGIAGALFYDQAVAVSIGLGVSFLCSVTLLPVIYYVLFKNSTEKMITQVRKISFMEKIYNWGLDWVFKYKKITIGICLAFFLSSYFIFDGITKEAFPAYPQKETVLSIDWNERISVEENSVRTKNLISTIHKDLSQSNTWIGQQDYLLNADVNISSSEAKVYLEALSIPKLEGVQQKLNNILRKNYPAANFAFESSENIFQKTFSNKDPAFILKLQQDDKEVDLKNIMQEIQRLVQNIKVPVKNKLPLEKYISLVVDFERLMIYKVSVQEVYNKLLTIFNKKEIGSINAHNDVIPVVIASADEDLTKQLDNARVINQDGAPIALSALIKQEEINDLKKIIADENSEYIPVEYDIPYAQRKTLENQVKKVLNSGSEAMSYSFAGSGYSFSKYAREFTVILIISIILLYFILAAQFESLVQPLILLIEIPIDIAAALWILYLFGESFNIMSAIGLIVMMGIIINDSILKIDAINHLYREENMPLMDAIHEGGRRRLRPIIMTSLTTLLAVAPVLFSSDLGSSLQKPLALALTGGLTVGTLVSLYLIPVIYWYINRKKNAPLVKH